MNNVNMSNVFTVIANPDQNSELTIHPVTAELIGLGKMKFANVSFGHRKFHVNIKVSKDLSPENVLLSQNLVHELYLPEDPVYEISVQSNEIIIGPYIGLLLSEEDRRLTASRLDKMLVYTKEYAKIHGAIVVFALDKVDKRSRLIEGYCFNPVKKYWQKGVFPYPAAIYRTIGLSPRWKNHFLSVIGDKIFNSHFFSKWQMYQWFSKEPEINPYIPFTTRYHSPQDVLEMLERFERIYIKPVFGLQGRGIIRMNLENGNYLVKYHENGVNLTLTFEDSVKVIEYIEKRLNHGRYLIQQAVDLLEYKGGIIDFRSVLQKNQSNEWVCQAIIGRTGVKDGIVSNISSGGTAYHAENILKKALPEVADHIDEMILQIKALALAVCNKLDNYGIVCGTLGLDIGIDKQMHLWLIEINNRDPDPGIALDIHDTKLYYTLKNGPLYYAKYLAGFRDKTIVHHGLT